MDEPPDIDMGPSAGGGAAGQARAGNSGAKDSERRAGVTAGGVRSGRARSSRRPNREPEPGISLDEAVRSNGPLSVDETQSLGSTLASLLIRLHTAGTAHGDIRPATVFLAEAGARLGEGDPFRQAAIVADSVYFVAPELLDNPGAVSPATDVFALGAVLAFAATGVSPFASRSLTQPGDGSVTPDLSAVPEALRRVIERCLDRNSAARPTAIALSILFSAGLEDLPAPAPPASPMLPPPPASPVPPADLPAPPASPVSPADDGRTEAGAKPMLQRPLFYFVRNPRHGRAATAIGAAVLAAAMVAVVALGVFDGGGPEAAKSARGDSNPITSRSATSTSATTPATSPSSSPIAAAPISTSSAPKLAPPPPSTTSKAAAPPVAAPSTAPGRPIALVGSAGSAPAAPSGLRITSGYVMTVNASWASAPGATSYEISYSGSVSGANTVTATGTSTTLKGLFPSEQLCAKVRSMNQYGASAWVSAPLCIMVI